MSAPSKYPSTPKLHLCFVNLPFNFFQEPTKQKKKYKKPRKMTTLVIWQGSGRNLMLTTISDQFSIRTSIKISFPALRWGKIPLKSCLLRGGGNIDNIFYPGVKLLLICWGTRNLTLSIFGGGSLQFSSLLFYNLLVARILITLIQCPTGRVFQYRVGSGIGKNTG